MTITQTRKRRDSYAGGFDAGGPASAGGLVVSVANQDYYLIPWGDNGLGDSVGTQTFPVAGAVRLFEFNLLAKVTFTRMTVNISTPSAGGNAIVGFYTTAPGTSPGSLIQQAVFSTTAAGAKTTVVPQTTLNPGSFWLAWSMDNLVAQLAAAPITASMQVIFDGGAIIRTPFTNPVFSLVGTNLPASTGNTQANGVNNNNFPPQVLLEP